VVKEVAALVVEEFKSVLDDGWGVGAGDVVDGLGGAGAEEVGGGLLGHAWVGEGV